jgi:hypothetical protein
MLARVRADGVGERGGADLESIEGGSHVLCAGHDLVGGIDRGPRSNQPVHHLAIALGRRQDQRRPAVLRCGAGRGREAEGRWACAAHWQHTHVHARHMHCPARSMGAIIRGERVREREMREVKEEGLQREM